MVHCAWCGKDLRNYPNKYVWVDPRTLEIIERNWNRRRVCFCSEEHKQSWLNAEQIDVCIICYNAVKDAPIVKEIEKEGLLFYFCEEHQLEENRIDHYLDVIIEDFVHLNGGA